MISVREERCQRAVSSMTSVDTNDASNETHIHTCPRWVCVYCPVCTHIKGACTHCYGVLGPICRPSLGLWWSDTVNERRSRFRTCILFPKRGNAASLELQLVKICRTLAPEKSFCQQGFCMHLYHVCILTRFGTCLPMFSRAPSGSFHVLYYI